MDRYLFHQFVFEMDDELYDTSCVAFAQMAKNIVRKPNEKKVTFNYYPQEKDHLQLVAEGMLDDSAVQISNVKIHHTSPDVWNLKIVTAIDDCDGSYLATRADGNGLIAIRLVNEQVLDSLESDSVIEAQVVALAVNINIYENETVYAESVAPSADGKKLLIGDGSVIAVNYLVTHNANLTAEERNNKEHCFDNLVDIRGTITLCYKYPLNMLGMDLNDYYIANVMTDFGQIKVIIARPMMPADIEGFGVGNIIVGKVMLSGDVCIYDYEKYATKLNNQPGK